VPSHLAACSKVGGGIGSNKEVLEAAGSAQFDTGSGGDEKHVRANWTPPIAK